MNVPWSGLEPLEETPEQRRKRRIKKALFHVLFAVCAYGLLVVGARLLHRRVIYQPPSGAEAEAVPEGATVLTARAADGVEVRALEVPHQAQAPPKPDKRAKPEPPKPVRTIVHFHGNAETVDDNMTLAHELAKRGFDVVLVEYRGYGRSRGVRPTEEALYLDAEAVLDVLAQRGVGPERVVLYGQALGSGVAVEMAKRGRGARLVLVAPLTSTVDLARRVVPFLPLSWVIVDRFDNLGKAPSVEAPTLIVHGDIDDVIPFEQGERLSHALPHATLLKVDDGRHDNLYKSGTVLSALAAHAGT
jgi:pimeloyl-ACP methyl ester carboxylesterase